MYDKRLEQIERWRITGTIRTESPLHIGDGDRLPLLQRDCHIPEPMKRGLGKAEYASVLVDAGEQPMIPATSLKGALRGWATAHGLEERLIRQVFGDTGEKETDPGRGMVTFYDARLIAVADTWNTEFRFWSTKRRTVLTPQVAIDPLTRSAKEHLLYYVEYVPAGAEFQLAMTAQNATEPQRGFLLSILEQAFQSTGRPCRLGSETANGWGKAQWTLDRVEVMGMPEMAVWLAKSASTWTDGLRELKDGEKSGWLAAGTRVASARRDQTLGLKLQLQFSGPVLINDPTQQRKAEDDGQNAVGHAMIRREDGQVFLPAQSVRGAFRAQARRIWQTLAWESAEGLNALAAFDRMFGATGWRTPVEVGSFSLDGQGAPHAQEFVAVDRFTGGAAKEKKFRADGLLKPSFRGEITIRLDRWAKAKVGPWAWLLLAYTLRDWIEGDGVLGYGASKGYGAFRAAVEVSGESKEADLLRGVLARKATALEDPALEQWERSLRELFGKEAA
ncbi:MAG: RAMP superfamily CRISPR-associated protein [Planctomycetota bacterium]